ncbi:MAG: CysG [Ramlibacter sp.]|jgi:uroporphyrin-III C-methyltransferase/precorrin-2 dehydrogenase/sirohydrochlorin ferrochelatase|nr:CysG [Ramlibacter sp.]
MNSFVDLKSMLSASRASCGTVYLVGAGPGDPDLLTLRAARLLAQADAVVYDHLVGADVLELVAPHAQRIYVGKERAKHTLQQEGINTLLVRLAREHACVVRLKGGDPFVFGRGGEELQVLAAEGVPFEVVPGVTAGCGVAAYAGIPLTHRDHAQSCLFVTGHLKDGSCDLDWPAIARRRQTVVIYMGLAGLATICERLIAHGLPPDWPAAVVEQGTLVDQRVVTATLATLAEAVDNAGLESPCLTIVGEVVRLRDQLAWFEPRAGVTATTETRPLPVAALS